MKSSRQLMRVNIGCGRAPTPGWINIDNSPSVRLAQHPILARCLERLGLIGNENKKVIQRARDAGIIWANGIRLSMLADASVDAVYSSHMIDQLDRDEVRRFLEEIRRVLMPGGIVRLVIADLRMVVQEYLKDNDADRLVMKSHLCVAGPKTFRQRLEVFLFGVRCTSLWAYDGASLCKLLEANGFCEARILLPNETTIPDPGPLDLAERMSESAAVEARKPLRAGMAPRDGRVNGVGTSNGQESAPTSVDASFPSTSPTTPDNAPRA